MYERDWWEEGRDGEASHIIYYHSWKLFILHLYKELIRNFLLFYSSYRDAEKNFHNISNRCTYTDCAGNEETEDVSGILQCTANVLGMYFLDHLITKKEPRHCCSNKGNSGSKHYISSWYIMSFSTHILCLWGNPVWFFSGGALCYRGLMSGKVKCGTFKGF